MLICIQVRLCFMFDYFGDFFIEVMMLNDIIDCLIEGFVR